MFAGLAGFYLLRPSGVASLALDLLFPGVYDFPLALQDRTFADVAGAGVCLCYATAPNDNDLRLGVWVPEWAGRVAVVNGKVWPVVNVAQRPYRFRLLDGTNARVFNLYITAVGGDDVAACQAALTWYQIGVEGGLYTASRRVLMRLPAAHRQLTSLTALPQRHPRHRPAPRCAVAMRCATAPAVLLTDAARWRSAQPLPSVRRW